MEGGGTLQDLPHGFHPLHVRSGQLRPDLTVRLSSSEPELQRVGNRVVETTWMKRRQQCRSREKEGGITRGLKRVAVQASVNFTVPREHYIFAAFSTSPLLMRFA
jgi:hypothetical protein